MKIEPAGNSLCWRLLACISAVAASAVVPYLALKVLALLTQHGSSPN